jgi:hypothetical protein
MSSRSRFRAPRGDQAYEQGYGIEANGADPSSYVKLTKVTGNDLIIAPGEDLILKAYVKNTYSRTVELLANFYLGGTYLGVQQGDVIFNSRGIIAFRIGHETLAQKGLAGGEHRAACSLSGSVTIQGDNVYGPTVKVEGPEGGDPETVDPSDVEIRNCYGIPASADPNESVGMTVNVYNKANSAVEGDLVVKGGSETLRTQPFDAGAGVSKGERIVFRVPDRPGNDVEISVGLTNITAV